MKKHTYILHERQLFLHSDKGISVFRRPSCKGRGMCSDWVIVSDCETIPLCVLLKRTQIQSVFCWRGRKYNLYFVEEDTSTIKVEAKRLCIQFNKRAKKLNILLRCVGSRKTCGFIAKGTSDPRHWVLLINQHPLFKAEASASLEFLVKL